MNRINHLFMRFAAIWGHKWTSSIPSDAATAVAVAEWAAGLRDMTDNQISAGIDRVRRLNEWPPSLPEFRRICLRIPAQREAIRRALAGEQDQISTAIRNRIGPYNMRHKSEHEVEKIAEAVYPDVVLSVSEYLTDNRICLGEQPKLEAPKKHHA